MIPRGLPSSVVQLRKTPLGLLLVAQAESARGISPRAAHRSVLDSLPSHGSCHSMRTAALRRNQRAPPVASWPITISTRMAHPLRSTDITPLLHYYEVVRPLVSPPYFRPRGSNHL